MPWSTLLSSHSTRLTGKLSLFVVLCNANGYYPCLLNPGTARRPPRPRSGRQPPPARYPPRPCPRTRPRLRPPQRPAPRSVPRPRPRLPRLAPARCVTMTMWCCVFCDHNTQTQSQENRSILVLSLARSPGKNTQTQS